MDSVSPLITAEELHARMHTEHKSGVAPLVLDASWHLPNVQRNAAEEFGQCRLPGARFFDIDAVSDRQTNLPHMLPSAEEFSRAVSQLGVGPESVVVVYDSVGLFSAARVWWMFRIFGHRQVRVLDGGLPAWQVQGYELHRGPVEPLSSTTSADAFNARLDERAVSDWQSLLTAIDSRSVCILDARPKARFDGAVPEPREGLRSGHMPTAVSLPYTELLRADDHGVMRLKSADILVELFRQKGVVDGSEVVTTCGSGVTAAVITLALHVAGFKPGRLYDGSWSEWGSLTQTPVV